MSSTALTRAATILPRSRLWCTISLRGPRELRTILSCVISLICRSFPTRRRSRSRSTTPRARRLADCTNGIRKTESITSALTSAEVKFIPADRARIKRKCSSEWRRAVGLPITIHRSRSLSALTARSLSARIRSRCTRAANLFSVQSLTARARDL